MDNFSLHVLQATLVLEIVLVRYTAYQEIISLLSPEKEEEIIN